MEITFEPAKDSVRATADSGNLSHAPCDLPNPLCWELIWAAVTTFAEAEEMSFDEAVEANEARGWRVEIKDALDS